MTVEQVISEIEKLGTEEKVEIATYLQPLLTSSQDDCMDNSTFKAAVEEVFEVHDETLRKLAQ